MSSVEQRLKPLPNSCACQKLFDRLVETQSDFNIKMIFFERRIYLQLTAEAEFAFDKSPVNTIVYLKGDEPVQVMEFVLV